VSRRNRSAKRGGASDRVHDDLKQMILSGRLAPNGQYLESELANMLGVSRTPIREACVRLATDGLAEIVPRHGIRITPLSADDVADVYEVLTCLEGQAAALAAARPVRSDDLAALKALCAEMTEALAEGDLSRWVEADREFHLRLVTSSDNPHLAVAAERFVDLAHRARLMTIGLQTPPASVDDHEALVAAVEKGKPKQARELLLALQENSGAALVEILRQMTPPGAQDRQEVH